MAALMSVDAETLGRLITAGHESLRSDYAATTPQTDAIVAEAGDTMVASAGGRSEDGSAAASWRSAGGPGPRGQEGHGARGG